MKICCIFNYAPHYRLPIYQAMDDEFSVDFYFGDRLPDNEIIKKFNYDLLKGFKKEFHVSVFKRIIIWHGIVRLAFKPYDCYIINPTTRSITLWLFLILTKLMGKKVYGWWHGIAPNRATPPIELKKQKLFFKILHTGHLIYGDKAREYMIKLGFKRETLTTIYNSLNYNISLKQREQDLSSSIYKEHFMNDNPVLIFIGRLTKVKNLPMIIQAQKNLHERGLEVNVVFVGDGPMKSELEASLSEIQRKHFWFYGHLYDETKISELLYNASVCVSPGNVGLTAIHSIYYGLPVISNNNFTLQMPEHEAIVEGKSGAFFKYGDLDSFTDCIYNWIMKSQDRDSVRQACYEIADTKFNPQVQIDIIKRFIVDSLK